MKNKTIIIGAGLGGLTTGIMLKKARPDDEVIIYDANKHPGGFCNAFEKAATYNNEKIKYTINIPLITGDFSKGAPFDKLLDYMGVKNLNWKIVDNFFQFYPVKGEPFSVTKHADKDFFKLVSSKEEAKNLQKYFLKLKRVYNDLFHKANLPPTFFQAIKMLFTMPKTIIDLLFDEPYLKAIERIGIKAPLIKDILSSAEAFLGCDVDKVSAMVEMCMLQSFLQENSVQPAAGNTFQDLADNFAERFKELGGKLILNTRVSSIKFDKRKAAGVTVDDETIDSDNVIISVSQDLIKPLILPGKHLKKVKKLINMIDNLSSPNSDYYCYYLIDKKIVDENKNFSIFRITFINFRAPGIKPTGKSSCGCRINFIMKNTMFLNRS